MEPLLRGIKTLGAIAPWDQDSWSHCSVGSSPFFPPSPSRSLPYRRVRARVPLPCRHASAPAGLAGGFVMSGWDDRERCRKGCGDLRLCEDGRSAWSPPPQPPPPPLPTGAPPRVPTVHSLTPSLLLPLPVSHPPFPQGCLIADRDHRAQIFLTRARGAGSARTRGARRRRAPQCSARTAGGSSRGARATASPSPCAS